jgi:hypothetical protein
MSRPVRFSGSRRHAKRPAPTNPQPTAGPKIANASFASWWSLASASMQTPTPATRAAKAMPANLTGSAGAP